jgi:hypothetical protein
MYCIAAHRGVIVTNKCGSGWFGGGLSLLLPDGKQLLCVGIERFQWQAADALENHHGVDAGQRIDFPRQRALFAGCGVLPAPIIDCFFELGQRNIHRRIVRLTRLIASRRFGL